MMRYENVRVSISIGCVLRTCRLLMVLHSEYCMVMSWFYLVFIDIALWPRQKDDILSFYFYCFYFSM